VKIKLIVFGAIALALGLSVVLRPSLPEREQAQTVLVETDHGWGSAVTVKRGGMCFAWTAAHTVKNSAKVKVHRVLRYHGHKAGNYTCDAHVLKLLLNQDAALLLIDGDPDQFRDATFSFFYSKPGDKISHVGNIHGPAFDASFEYGVVSQTGVTVEEEACLLDQGSFAIAPGCSGGPVFNSLGNVIGLGVAYVGPGVSLYVPTRVLEGAAENANLDWAIRGYSHPSVKELEEMISSREKEVALLAKPPEFLPFLFFGAPPENK